MRFWLTSILLGVIATQQIILTQATTASNINTGNPIKIELQSEIKSSTLAPMTKVQFKTLEAIANNKEIIVPPNSVVNAFCSPAGKNCVSILFDSISTIDKIKIFVLSNAELDSKSNQISFERSGKIFALILSTYNGSPLGTLTSTSIGAIGRGDYRTQQIFHPSNTRQLHLKRGDKFQLLIESISQAK